MGHKNGEFILDGPFDMSLVCCLMSREWKVEIFKQFHLTISDTSRHEINLKKFNLEIKIHFSAITKISIKGLDHSDMLFLENN